MYSTDLFKIIIYLYNRIFNLTTGLGDKLGNGHPLWKEACALRRDIQSLCLGLDGLTPDWLEAFEAHLGAEDIEENYHYAQGIPNVHLQDLAYRILEYRNRGRKRIPLNPTVRFEILKRDGYRCQICGADKDDDVKMEIDHKIPVVKGGTDDPSNLWVLCFECNRGKGTRNL